MKLKDLKPGDWFTFVNSEGEIRMCLGDNWIVWRGNDFPERTMYLNLMAHNLEVTPMPDCTGWDWQPQKHEAKWRPFTKDEYVRDFLSRRFHCFSQKREFCVASAVSDDGIFFAGYYMTWKRALDELQFVYEPSKFGVLE